MTKLRFLLLIVLFGVGGYLWVKGPEGLKWPGAAVKEPEATKGAKGTKEIKGAEVANVAEVANGIEGVVRVHYFTKEGLAACSTETVTRAVTPDPKYGHAGAGALVVQTLALTGEDAEKYASALVPGTRLLSMKMSPTGVATADYNTALNSELNDCNKAQRKAQIERTLKEFSEIKNVAITVEGKVWQ